jgi:hypothetical protein
MIIECTHTHVSRIREGLAAEFVPLSCQQQAIVQNGEGDGEKNENDHMVSLTNVLWMKNNKKLYP